MPYTAAVEDTGWQSVRVTGTSEASIDVEGKAVSGKVHPKVAEGPHLLTWGGSWVRMHVLLLTEPVTLSQASGFLGLSFIIHLKLVLEVRGLFHRRSHSQALEGQWAPSSWCSTSQERPEALPGEPNLVTFLLGLFSPRNGHLSSVGWWILMDLRYHLT